MKHIAVHSFVIAALLSLAGCATYNSYAPDWAQIGSDDTETVSNEEGANPEAQAETSPKP